MTIRERTTYPLPPEEVWPYLASPELFTQWNPRIRKLHARGEFAPGDEFWTEYVLSKNTTVCSSRVVHVASQRSLVLEHTQCQTQSALTDLHVRESFELVPKGTRTLLKHTVRIRHHGMNIAVVILFWIITTFGTTVEADLLEKLLSGRMKSRLGEALK